MEAASSFFFAGQRVMYQARFLSRKFNALSYRSHQQRRFLEQLTSPELRSRFIKYFEKQGHVPVKSASLVPHNDKSLLFTNAGKQESRCTTSIKTPCLLFFT